MADECILGYLRYCGCHIFVRTALSLPFPAGSQPDTASPQLLLTGLFLKNYLNVYFGFEEGNSFYIHFPALLSNPEEQEMLFGGCFSFFWKEGGFALFICLFICFTLTSQMFFVTPTSAACLVQGPGGSSRVVTMQTHRDSEGSAALCLCILPWCISAGKWQFSRCYKGLETCY